MNENLSYSPAGYALTKGFESLSLKAYQNAGDVPTIGYGHTRGVKLGDTCTTEQAEQWLREDVAEAERLVRAEIIAPLSQNQFDALVDFTFNAGAGNLSISDIRKAIFAGDMERAAEGFSHFTRGGGKVLKGLVRRRDAEAAMFRGEL